MDELSNRPERLHKVIARLGISSRRAAESMIRHGLVSVNGQTVTEPGIKVNAVDQIMIDGQLLRLGHQMESIYILLNKPIGVISSVRDQFRRKTVMDLLGAEIKSRVYPVGRLDYDTSGLLLLTNDGELTFRLTHPSFGVAKTYRVGVKGNITKLALDQLRTGVVLEDGVTAPAKIERIEQKKGNALTLVEITIQEGKNRQVRRMFAKTGYQVVSLQRIAFGPLGLNGLKVGEYRLLSKHEVESLKKQVKLG